MMRGVATRAAWVGVMAVAVMALRQADAQNTWTGTGTTSLWSDSGNWTGPPGTPVPPSTDAMLFFSGTTGTNSINDGAVSSVVAKVIGTNNGIVFSNDGLSGKTAGFRLSGSAITLKGYIETLSAVTSPAMTITDEIANDLQLTIADFTQIYTRTYNTFAHNLTISGVIFEDGVSRTLRKGGTGGTLTLTGENIFTGQMQINVGVVAVDRLENVGQPSPLGAGNLPVRLGTGALYGILQYSGTGETTNRYVQVGSGPNTVATGTSTITANGSGPLVFTVAGRDMTHPLYGNDYFNQNDAAVTSPGRMLTLNGTNTGANEIQTVIIDNVNASGGLNTGLVSPVSVTKAGSGTWILSGTNTYSGTTTISGGMLQIGNGGTTGRLGFGPTINNATLTYKRADDVTLTTAIIGSGRLVQAGAGTLTLGTAQPFTGATRIDAGTLSLGETGSISASPSVTVAAGASFFVADVAGGVYAVPATQTLTGNGTIVGALSIAGGATISPGSSPGTLSVTDAVTLASGGNYTWQMFSATGAAGAPDSWDLLDVGGTLTIASTTADPFRLNLWTLSGTGPDVSGAAANFNAGQSYTWKIASAAGGITGFEASKFLITTTATNGTGGFANSLGGGTFSLAQSGNDLNLVFTSAAPSVITISVPSGTQTQTQAGYATLSGSIPVVKTGAGTLVLDQANTLSGSTTVQAGRLQLANGSALASSRLIPVAGGTVTLAPFQQTTVGGLTASAGGVTDVGSGAMTVASGLATPDMLAALLAGRGDGSWTGTTGITSSQAAADLTASIPRTVGWLDNGDGSVTFAFAAPGDTNLDWNVDILDAANFLAGGKFDSGAAATWNEGDFGYDGVVDILDAADFLSTGLFDAGAYNPPPASAPGITAVPEPSVTLLGVSLAALACMPRGRRRK
jgi:fibronectin-binding autotransporter adhesin